MADPPGNCLFQIVEHSFFRSAPNGFLSRSTRPVNPSGAACSTYFDGAPLQQNVYTETANRPRLGCISAHIRLMDTDTEEFRHWMPYVETAESKMTSRLVGSRSAAYWSRQERCQSLLRLLLLNALIERICPHNRERGPRLFHTDYFRGVP